MRKKISLRVWLKMPAADQLQKCRRSARWGVERRSIEVELEQLAELLALGLVNVSTGEPIGARGALALGADVLLQLRWQRRMEAVTACN